MLYTHGGVKSVFNKYFSIHCNCLFKPSSSSSNVAVSKTLAKEIPIYKSLVCLAFNQELETKTYEIYYNRFWVANIVATELKYTLLAFEKRILLTLDLENDYNSNKTTEILKIWLRSITVQRDELRAGHVTTVPSTSCKLHYSNGICFWLVMYLHAYAKYVRDTAIQGTFRDAALGETLIDSSADSSPYVVSTKTHHALIRERCHDVFVGGLLSISSKLVYYPLLTIYFFIYSARNVRIVPKNDNKRFKWEASVRALMKGNSAYAASWVHDVCHLSIEQLHCVTFTHVLKLTFQSTIFIQVSCLALESRQRY
uniref:Uncharacterized protein n=1 Tax=Glossina palpalis gambiensis TaxID=67801 RepID=A0A1B0BS20_9MUSC